MLVPYSNSLIEDFILCISIQPTDNLANSSSEKVFDAVNEKQTFFYNAVFLFF